MVLTAVVSSALAVHLTNTSKGTAH